MKTDEELRLEQEAETAAPTPEVQADDFDAKAFMQAAKGGDPVPEVPGDPTIDPPADPTDPPPPVDMDPYWKGLSETYKGEDGKYEIPPEILTGKKENGEALTEQEKFQMLQDHIVKNNAPVIRDPFIAEYLEESQKQDFNQADFLQRKQKEVNVMNLPAKDFLKEIYKSESTRKNLNWTEEQIQAKLDKMDDIDAQFKADEFKQNIQSVQSQREYNIKERNRAKMEQELVTVKAETQALLDTFINENKEKTNIGGFEFGESDRQEFIEFLPEFTKKEIKQIGGEQYIASQADIVFNEIINDPAASLNILPYLYLVHKGKIDGFNADAIEAKKEELERKLKGERKGDIQVGAGQHGKTGFDKVAFMNAAKKR